MAACGNARLCLNHTTRMGTHGGWSRDTHEILGVHPEDLERVRSAFNSLDIMYKEQLLGFVSLLPSATKVDLRFLLFRLEASGKQITL